MGSASELQAGATINASAGLPLLHSVLSLPPALACADFYGAAEEVSLPFDQSDEAAAVDSWSKKL